MSEHSYPKRAVKRSRMSEKQYFAIGDKRIFSRWKNTFSCVEKYSFSKVKNMYFIRQPTVCVLIKMRFSIGAKCNFIGIAHFTLIDTTRTLLYRNYVIKWGL